MKHLCVKNSSSPVQNTVSISGKGNGAIVRRSAMNHLSGKCHRGILQTLVLGSVLSVAACGIDSSKITDQRKVSVSENMIADTDNYKDRQNLQGISCVRELNCMLGSDGNSLEQLILIAVSRNPKIAAEHSRVASAEAALQSAKWQKAPTPFVTGETNSSGASIGYGLKLRLFSAGANRLRVQQSRKQLSLAQTGFDQARLEVAIAVVEAYGRWYTAQRSRLAWEEALLEHQEVQQVVARRVDGGINDSSELSAVASRLSAIQSEILLAAADVQSSWIELNSAVGIELLEREVKLYDGNKLLSLNTSDEKISEAVLLQPALAASELQVDLQKDNLSELKRNLVPNLSLVLGNGVNSALAGGLSLGIASNFGPGLSARSEMNSASAEIDFAFANLEAVRQKETQKLIAARVLLQSSEVRLNNAREIVETSNQITRSVKRRWENGTEKSWQEVVAAARDLAENKAGLAAAEGIFVSSYWKLGLYANGIGFLSSRQK